MAKRTDDHNIETTLNIEEHSSSDDCTQHQKRKPVLCVYKLLTEDLSTSAFSECEKNPTSRRRKKKRLLSRRIRSKKRSFRPSPGFSSTDTEEDQRVRAVYRKYAVRLHSLPVHQARNIERWCRKPLPETPERLIVAFDQHLALLWTQWREHYKTPPSADEYYRSFDY